MSPHRYKRAVDSMAAAAGRAMCWDEHADEMAEAIEITTPEIVLWWVRSVLNMEQAEIAALMGVSQRQWSRYETGRSGFPKRKWYDILRLVVAIAGGVMPYRRVGNRVEKYEDGRWKLVKNHESARKAQKHVTALRINVEAKEKK